MSRRSEWRSRTDGCPTFPDVAQRVERDELKLRGVDGLEPPIEEVERKHHVNQARRWQVLDTRVLEEIIHIPENDYAKVGRVAKDPTHRESRRVCAMDRSGCPAPVERAHVDRAVRLEFLDGLSYHYYLPVKVQSERPRLEVS
jgi:hypothetical protein